ncbi:Uma2 family endonuclease [Anabaena sp. CS-542/02]|uniref:Uma2 family endonuclease n=1 Tax=Anabaena sp. CS-542/02 TaxID=3021719 RepID=UPI00232F2434|nr:Uma2 family endonuclease [Anabaena sp. CS-542/02]MDB9447107.1 Uma2 family endonuclease [Anabaena sp. CS-542/02]
MNIPIVTSEVINGVNKYLHLTGVSWVQFKNLESAFSSIPGVRLIYLDGGLEIVILGSEHEYYKRTISLLLEAYMRSENIRFYSQGSATLGSQEINAQKEPDESYSFNAQKATPDLVIEVIVTSGGINTLEVYQRIGIPEVWLWEDGNLKVYELTGECQGYKRVQESNLLPNLDLNLLTKYITYYDQYDAVTEFLTAMGKGQFQS